MTVHNENVVGFHSSDVDDALEFMLVIGFNSMISRGFLDRKLVELVVINF